VRRSIKYLALALFLTGAFLSTGAYMKSCEELPDPPQESLDACTGPTACPSGSLRRKDNLKNIFHSYFDECILSACLQFEWWWARVQTSWGYTVPSGTIRWRDSDVTSQVTSPIGLVSIPWSDWITSRCFTGGMDTCLTRREWQARADAEFNLGITTIVVHQYQYACVATRINGDGSHSRNAFEGHCPTSAQADAYATARAGARWTPPKTQFGHGAGTRLGRLERMNLGRDHRLKTTPARGLQDYVSRAQARALVATCWRGPNAMSSPECRRTVREVYSTLSPAEKRAVSTTLPRATTACAGLSAESLRRLHPGTRCERRAHRS
jgi:hypothetical protein